MIDVSIIIVNYSTTKYVCRLLESIVRFESFPKIEIIIVNNNSFDNEFKKIKVQYPFVKIVESENNDGFASGNNLGASFANGRYLLFLNPDIVLLNDNFNKLCNYLEDHPDTGILSGLMLDEDNVSLYFYNSFLNIEWEIYQLLGFGYSRKIKKLLNIDEIAEEKPFEVDWFHGAFIFISKENFNKIKGFNESHFMYFEDMHLCYDVKNKLSLKNVCLPSVKYIHETRATFKDVREDDLYFFHINRGKLIFLSNYRFFFRNIIKLISLFGIIIRILLLPFWGKFRERKKRKFSQLLKILRLHISNKYILKSKYEFVRRR